MARLRPGWLVALCAPILAVSAWLPWLTTTADGGGRANAIGGIVGAMPVPPPGFGVGQLIVLLASTLIVAGAMAAAVSRHGWLLLRRWRFRCACGADGLVLPALRVSAGVGGLRALPGRAVGGRRGAAFGVGDGWRPGRRPAGRRERLRRAGHPRRYRWVTLEPLTREHIPEIAAAAADGELGRCGSPSRRMRMPPSTGSRCGWRCRRPTPGLTFVVRGLDGVLVGSSSYLNVDAPQPPTGDRQHLVLRLRRSAPGSTARPSC